MATAPLETSLSERSQPAKPGSLVHVEGRSRTFESAQEWRGKSGPRPGFQLCNQGGCAAKSVHDDEVRRALVREQTRFYRLFEYRVYAVGHGTELPFIDSPEPSAGVADRSIFEHRLQVEQEASRNEAPVSSLQGVHDALNRHSS